MPQVPTIRDTISDSRILPHRAVQILPLNRMPGPALTANPPISSRLSQYLSVRVE